MEPSVEDEQERAARQAAIPDSHGHAKGEHKAFAEERPIPYTARMLFLWFYHACRRGSPRFMMVADHVNYLTFEDPAAVNLVRRALKLAGAGDLLGAAETAGVEVQHAAVVSEGLRRGMRYSIGAEVDNDPRNRPDAQNIVDAMRPDAIVRSIHFLSIDHAELGAGYQWAFDNPEFQHLYEEIGTEKVWELYVAALLEAIDKLPTNIVGHFYVPAKFGHWPDDATLERYEDQLIELCAERGYAIEVNSRIFYRTYVPEELAQAQRQRYFDAHLRLLQKAKAKGVMISVGSDAHSPRDQGGGFDAVLEMLDGADINEVAFPTNGRIARVALRVTEELLRPSLPEPPPLPALDAEDQDDDDEDESGEPSPEHPASEEPPAAATPPAAAAAPATAAKPPRKRSRPARPAETVETARESEASVEIEGVSIVEAIEAEGEVVEAVVVAGEVVIPEPASAGAAPPAVAKRPRRSPKRAIATDAPGAAFAGEPPPPVDPAQTTPPKRTRAPKAAPPIDVPVETALTASREVVEKPPGKAEPKAKGAPAPSVKAKPAAAKPPAAKPPAAKPAAAKPAATKPAAAKPAAAKPAASKTAASKPAPAKTAAPRSAPPKAAAAAKPAKKAAPKTAARDGAKKSAAKPPARAAKKASSRPVARKPAAKAPVRKAAAKKAAPKRPPPKIAKRSAPAKRVGKKTTAKATAKKKPSKSRR